MPTQTPLDNREFAERAGCSISMASRLRTGDRLPSIYLLRRISEAFGISIEDLVKAHGQGPMAFSALLRRRAFGEAV